MDTLEAIKKKKDVRLWLDRPVPQETILRILDAGRRTGSSKNSQPWHFICVRDRGTIEALANARPMLHVAKAAFVVVLVMDRPGMQSFDAGRAAQNMMLAACNEGVGSCPVWLGDPEKLRPILGVPEGRYPDAAVAFGYFDEAGEQAQRAQRPGPGRRPLGEVAFWDAWDGKPVA